ncbi:phosphomannomutase [candidate division LCP-89 bacterium B3_LCP]|uniref:Phosphomannomutase n=1 Tax=candidate division LCP-89 bacterium B3_LCP TaxID=2012998 RepID=A0A532UPS7_UNCL8|nr:MAG: phosphomannomutase [candidate division LCP-89 bacterium B3_LCP]
MNPLIFREYDIRGVADKDLDDDTVKALGRGFGSKLIRLGGKTISLGRDVRLSSPRIKDALLDGLLSTGLQVIDLGIVPTPLLYFGIAHLKTDGGVMITGSHNPPEFNGFKMCVGKDSIYGEEIQELYLQIKSGSFESGQGSVKSHDIFPAYKDYLKENLKIDLPIKMVIDCGNGCGGLVAPELFQEMGCLVDVLYGEPDGNFPNHHPDPTVAENLDDLIHRTKSLGYDLGIAYDGDADRIGVIDDMGNILWGDQLLTIFSRSILKNNPGASIIGEVKCSQNLYNDIREKGGNPIMWKTGHSLIKKKMREEKALLAGEMSGHIFFNDRYFGFDDAIYATGRLLELLCEEARPLSQLLWGLPQVFATPEIRIDCPDEEKFSLVEKAQEFFKSNYEVVDVDGVRVIFDDGWGLIRASNTQPVIVMRFEANSPERLAEIKSLMEAKLEELKSLIIQ